MSQAPALLGCPRDSNAMDARWVADSLHGRQFSFNGRVKYEIDAKGGGRFPRAFVEEVELLGLEGVEATASKSECECIENG